MCPHYTVYMYLPHVHAQGIKYSVLSVCLSAQNLPALGVLGSRYHNELQVSQDCKIYLASFAFRHLHRCLNATNCMFHWWLLATTPTCIVPCAASTTIQVKNQLLSKVSTVIDTQCSMHLCLHLHVLVGVGSAYYILTIKEFLYHSISMHVHDTHIIYTKLLNKNWRMK
jgi:hypothetical protein